MTRLWRYYAVFAAVFVAGLALLCLLALGRPAHAESRIYPFAGPMYRFESGQSARLWGEVGAAYSLGRIAPSVTGQLAVPEAGRKGAVGVEFRLRVKLGH